MHRILFYFLVIVLVAACNNDTTTEAGASVSGETKASDTKEQPVSGKFDCSTFLWFKKGTVLDYASSDAKGKVVSNTSTTIDDVHEDNGTLVADYTVSYNTKKIRSQYRCKDGVLFVNMKSMFEDIFSGLQRAGVEIEVSDAYLSFPWAMKEGDDLDEAAFEIKSKQNGKDFMTMKSQIKNRKVGGIEKVTTPAGTWDCVKLLETRVLSTSMMGKQMPAKEIKTTEWFAPGAGLVKTDSYDDKGLLLHTTELTSIK